ncbi:MAG: LysR family transcriptional regulator [Amylibacter sp.]|nr:LysR family transcriptional regulator [Amylibacter sp.]
MPISPPRPKGPPLNALRAFEAAARLGGFTPAAEELCVTPGAISQHIKSLEEWAGAALFERRSQGVSLTELGEIIASDFTTAFDAMGQAVRTLRTSAAQSAINIAALPSIAQLWLSPRLPAIRNRLKDHKISVTALETPPNLIREMFDISLFLKVPTDHSAEQIIKADTIYPVCTPEIAERIRTPADLLQETWLYDALWADDWKLWLDQTNHKKIPPQSGPSFSLYSIAIEEAKNGAGILIGHEVLIEPLLKSGALVAPFGQKALTGKSLVLELAPNFTASDHLQQVASMLRKNS